MGWWPRFGGVTDASSGERFDYDEFGLFHENIAEFDLDVDHRPPVERVSSPAADDPRRSLSALRFGAAPIRTVFVHGGAQNAHTWDTVILALGEPALAIDLPGHGHSDWRSDGGYTPRNMADDVAAATTRRPPIAGAYMSTSAAPTTRSTSPNAPSPTCDERGDRIAALRSSVACGPRLR